MPSPRRPAQDAGFRASGLLLLFEMKRLALGAVLGIAACSADAEPTEKRASRIVGGALDAEHPAVLGLLRRDGGTCSAVLVAPTIALTAGHCTWGASPQDLSVTLGASASAPERIFGVRRVALYPTAQGSDADAPGGTDLAALELDGPVPATPIAMAAPIGDQGPSGREVTIVGFGRTSAFDPTSAGTRESASLRLGASCSRNVRLGDDATNVCYGDSGGAVLLSERLFAIVVAGRDGCDTPSLATRVDAHAAWLARVREGRLDEPCPECVPPDASCDAAIEVVPSALTPQADATRGWTVGGGGGCELARRDRSTPSTSAAFGLALLVRALRRRAQGAVEKRAGEIATVSRLWSTAR